MIAPSAKVLVFLFASCRSVFITGRRQSELEKAVTTIEEKVTAIQGDTSQFGDIDRIYQIVMTQAGRIDVLFVNAGFYEFGKFGEIPEEHFDKTFNTNVRGLFFALQKALPIPSYGWSAILTGSIASIKGSRAFSVYNATKAAERCRCIRQIEKNTPDF